MIATLTPENISGDTPYLWWWILGGVIYLAAGSALQQWLRHRREKAGAERFTGRTFEPVTPRPSSLAMLPIPTPDVVDTNDEGTEAPLIWRGNGRGILGHQRAPVQLVIRQGEIAMRTRPWLLTILTDSLWARAGDSCVAFPARHRWGPRGFVGIGIRTNDIVGYFEIDDPAPVLSYIADAGFEVDWRERILDR